MKNIMRRGAVVLAVTAVIGGTFIAPAEAWGGTCSVGAEKQAVSLAPDDYRVWARCSSLTANTKARGDRNIGLGLHQYTSWFTKLNTTYTSGWGKGGTKSVSVNFAAV